MYWCVAQWFWCKFKEKKLVDLLFDGYFDDFVVDDNGIGKEEVQIDVGNKKREIVLGREGSVWWVLYFFIHYGLFAWVFNLRKENFSGLNRTSVF